MGGLVHLVQRGGGWAGWGPIDIPRPRYGAFRQNITMTFGVEKLEW